MNLFTNEPIEDTFRITMDYFLGKQMKILTSPSPCYIKAELGVWVSMSLGNAKGEVEATITKRDSGCYVNFIFSFLKEYLGNLIITILGGFVSYGVMLWSVNEYALRGIAPSVREGFLSFMNWLMIVAIIIIFGIVIASSVYNVSQTKKRFIEQFSEFVQSIPSKKD
jgi:uncharacterized membrane protein YidH (DUF202 family)